MTGSKFVEANEKIAETVTAGYRKIEHGVVTGYQKIEDGVVGGYKKIETGVVNGFNKITDQFVDRFLAEDGETTEEAKARLTHAQETPQSHDPTV